MSSLQVSIIILGIIAILGVVAYNWWQEKKVQQRIKQQFPHSEYDPLIESIGSINPDSKKNSEHTISGSASVKQSHDEEQIDAQCEAVFDIHFYTPVVGSQLISHLQPLKSTGSKPIRYFADTSDNFHRARILPNEMYSSVKMAILLANRSGALRVEEWDRAVVYADSIAQDFDGTIEAPNKEQVLAQAQALDRLCNNLEAQVGVKLILEGTQPVKAILTIAQRLGYTEWGPGHVRLHESGKPLFLLLLGGELSGNVRSAGVDYVELMIDVPNSYQIENPFTNLIKQAHELARALQAQVVDDEGDELLLDNPIIPVVDEQLLNVYQELEKHGFVAGSERTTRVFS